MNANEPAYLDPPPTPRALEGPPARGTVMVVAPHADDELIGPGGTVLLHRELGDPVHIVVLTDGRTGDARSKHEPAEYQRIREDESRACAELLGAESIEFLAFPDGRRAREEDMGVVVPRLLQEFERVQPDVIYAPHLGEVHADHYVTGVAVQRTIAACQRPMRCFGYEIWAALEADFVVDITRTIDRKMDIAKVFASQFEHTDMRHFFSGLNAYRAVYLPKGARYGEAFKEMYPGS